MTDLLEPLVSFSTPFDYPWTTGGLPASAKVRPLHIAINGTRFAVDFTKYVRRTVQVKRTPVDDSVEPGEQTLSADGLWRRAQDTFFLGAGQLFLDNRFAYQSIYTATGEFPSVRTRYWRSKGINPWGAGGFTLQTKQANKRASANTNIATVATIDRVYVLDGADVLWSTNPDAVSPTWTSAGVSAASGAATLTSLATDGQSVWASTATNVYVTANGATTASLQVAHGADLLGYANGRLLGALAAAIFEIPASGAIVAIFTHPNAAFRWTTVTSSPTAILVGGNAGSLSFVGAIQPSASTGALLTPINATTLPVGELIYDIAYSAGSLLLCTSRGMRGGDRPDGSGVFDIRPAITDFGACLCAAPWLEFAYAGVTAYDTFDEETTTASVLSSGLARLNLSNFTQRQIPAYSTDVMADDGTSAAVTSVAILNGVPYFTLSGVGLWGPTTDVVGEGTLSSGWIRYGVTEKKVLAVSKLRHDRLEAGESVQIQCVDELGVVHDLGVSDTAGQTAPASPFGGNLIVGERFMIALTLTPGTDTTHAPTLRFWQAEAIAAPTRQDEITAPIMLFSKVTGSQLDGREYAQDTLARWQMLRDLCNSGEPFLFQEGDEVAEQAILDMVQMEPTGMNDQWSWFEGLCTIRIVTLSAGGST